MTGFPSAQTVIDLQGMTMTPMKTAFRAALLSSAALTLAACGDEAPTQAEGPVAEETLELTITSAITRPIDGGIADIHMLSNAEQGFEGVAIAAQRAGGLIVYDIDGFELQSLPSGRYGAISASPDFQLRGAALPLVAGLDLEDGALSLYGFVRENRELVAAPYSGFAPDNRPRALCGGDSNLSRLDLFVLTEGQLIEHWRISDTGRDTLTAERLDQIPAPFEARDCAYDPEGDALFLSSPVGEIARLGPSRAVEGMASIPASGLDVGVFAGARRLIVSSQDSLLLVNPNTLNTVESLRFGPGLTIPELVSPGAVDYSAQSYGGAYPDGVIGVSDSADNLLKFIALDYLERELSEPENRFAPMPPRES